MPGTFYQPPTSQEPLVSGPGMHHGTCVAHVPWCMSGSLTRARGENVPGYFTYLVRDIQDAESLDAGHRNGPPISFIVPCHFCTQGKHMKLPHIYALSYLGPPSNIIVSSYQYRKSDCGDRTKVTNSYCLHNSFSYTVKTVYLFATEPWLYDLLNWCDKFTSFDMLDTYDSCQNYEKNIN